VIDHDLGAERLELGAAAGQRPGVVVDDPDLELLPWASTAPGGDALNTRAVTISGPKTRLSRDRTMAILPSQGGSRFGTDEESPRVVKPTRRVKDRGRAGARRDGARPRAG